MTRRLTLGAAALLLSCFATAAPAATPAAKPAADPAAALLDSICVRYATLSNFHFTGQTHVEISGAAMPQTNRLDIPFVFAAVRPGKLRTEMRNPVMPSELVSDGDTLWMSALSLRQYSGQPAPAIMPGSSANDPAARSLDPLHSYAMMREGLTSVVTTGRDTVMTAAGPISCRRIVATYSPDPTEGAPEMLPRVLWVDEARHLVVRDSMSMNLRHPQMGALSSIQDTRFVTLDPVTGGPETLYRFAPPAGSRRVARVGAPEPVADEREGKPAPDFTLAALAGKSVQLSKLKGKVVVLDFWATWCGPCRRWMPIVEKVTKEAASKGVLTYAVNVRETPAKVRTYLAQSGVTVPVLLDANGAAADAYGASSIPLTVVVGRDGRIVKAMVGVHTEEDMRAALAAAGVH